MSEIVTARTNYLSMRHNSLDGRPVDGDGRVGGDSLGNQVALLAIPSQWRIVLLWTNEWTSKNLQYVVSAIGISGRNGAVVQ